MATMTGPVLIDGHLYLGVEIHPVRTDYDFHFWENSFYRAACHLNGRAYNIQRESASLPYTSVGEARPLNASSPVEQASWRACACSTGERMTDFGTWDADGGFHTELSMHELAWSVAHLSTRYDAGLTGRMMRQCWFPPATWLGGGRLPARIATNVVHFFAMHGRLGEGVYCEEPSR